MTTHYLGRSCTTLGVSRTMPVSCAQACHRSASWSCSGPACSPASRHARSVCCRSRSATSAGSQTQPRLPVPARTSRRRAAPQPHRLCFPGIVPAVPSLFCGASIPAQQDLTPCYRHCSHLQPHKTNTLRADRCHALMLVVPQWMLRACSERVHILPDSAAGGNPALTCAGQWHLRWDWRAHSRRWASFPPTSAAHTDPSAAGCPSVRARMAPMITLRCICMCIPFKAASYVALPSLRLEDRLRAYCQGIDH